MVSSFVLLFWSSQCNIPMGNQWASLRLGPWCSLQRMLYIEEKTFATWIILQRVKTITCTMTNSAVVASGGK